VKSVICSFFYNTVLGYVAFVVGGTGVDSVELYSPNGKCQHQLAPVGVLPRPFIGIMNGLVVTCNLLFFNYQQCWTYDIENNNWNPITASSFTHNHPPCVLYNNHIYVIDDKNPEIYHPETGLWTDWSAPVLAQAGACTFVWKQNFVVLGGDINTDGVLMFNVTTETWNNVASTGVPFQLFYPGHIYIHNHTLLQHFKCLFTVYLCRYIFLDKIV
jgi:hypothetical protein